MAVIVGVDSGGTFTDVVAMDDEGNATLAKVDTVVGDVASGIIGGVRAVADGADVARIVHGTTVATNAILEQRGARTAVVTTAGFEDVLEIGRLKRSVLYDLQIDPETPTFVSPRRLRFGVPERVDRDGNVLAPLDEDAVVRVAQALRSENVESVAVCYLFSFRNPAHEQRTREILIDALPGVPVSLSSEVDPVFREYERLCVTAFNAYVAPAMSQYLNDVAERAEVPVEVMQSRGSVVSAKAAARLPVTTLLSGPAAGVVAAGAWAQRVGRPNAVGFDVGGTSADVSLLTGGAPTVWREGQIGTYPLRTPMIAIHTIGAGGGSIAWRNRVGELRVGPQSAGSTPGPAAYGRGGTLPTVTDASCQLGYMGEAIAGGRVRLALDAAEAALATLGDPSDVAQGIHRILNAAMADQIRLVTIRRGISPRSLALVAFGGAGPMHAVEVARQLGVREVIIPRHPGVLSAEGLLMAPADEEHVLAGRFALDEVPDALGELERRVNGATIISRAADMRYVGQAHELAVTVGGGGLRERFEQLHEGLYGYRNPGSAVEAMSVRVGIRRREPWQVVRYREQPASSVPPPATRRAWFLGTGWVETPIIRRPSLTSDGTVGGPVIVEDEDTTIVIPPDASAVLHESGALVVEVGA